LSKEIAAFSIASFLNALKCKSAGIRRLVPDRQSFSVSLSPKLAIIGYDTNAIQYYCQTVVYKRFPGAPFLARFLREEVEEPEKPLSFRTGLKDR